jgi:hypothetical protein
MQTHYTTQKAVYTASGKAIGKIRGDTFYKSIKGSRHMLRCPPAIALDLAGLNQAEQASALRVVVTDTETGTQYRSTIAHIRQAGFELDRGYGRQLALELTGWIQSTRGAAQLELFGGVK